MWIKVTRFKFFVAASLLAATFTFVYAYNGAAQSDPEQTPPVVTEADQRALLRGGIVPADPATRPQGAPAEADYPARSVTALALTGNIAFESDRAGTFDLYAQNAAGNDLAVLLSTGPGSDVTPVWSPDGTQMVFSSDRDGDYDIYLRRADGQEMKLTQNVAQDAHPSWAPAGDRIIFSSNRGGDYFQIYTMRPDGSDVQQVGIVPGNNAMYPRYSPDGQQIAFMRASITAPQCLWNWDVWRMDTNGNNQVRVTNRLGADLYPTWTPDGTGIVYSSCRNFFDFNLYAVDIATGNEVQVTNWSSNEWGLVFSPDEENLAFNADIEGDIDIFVGSVAGGSVSNLTQNGADDLAASWGSQTVTSPPKDPPLVLVHGIQLFSLEGFSCEPDIMRYADTSETTLDDDDLDPTDHIAYWLDEEYEVWIAHLSSSAIHTPSLEQNAECLEDQINKVYEETGRKIILVTHSMGGLVSRACLSRPDCRDKIEAIYTLGSPHAGFNAGLVAKILLKLGEEYLMSHGVPLPVTQGLCAWQPAVCQMTVDGMFWFNMANNNQRDITYTFIGGDTTPPWPGWFFFLTEGLNDGAVGRYNAVGWVYPFRSFLPFDWAEISPPKQYWTDEVHIAAWGQAYYEARDNGSRSQAYRCMKEGTVSGACRAAQTSLLTTDTPPALTQTTLSLDGQIATGQMVNHTIQVDTNQHAIFQLAWVTGNLTFSLRRPDGQVIDPAYAAANPDQVTYTAVPGSAEFPPFATYAFTNTQPGLWTLTINGTDAGPTGRNYLAFVAMETDRSLSFSADNDLYSIGSTAIFSATLQGPSGGISGATVEATLRRPDNLTDTLVLTDQGNGLYKSTYTIPNAPGYIVATITAQGNDDGTLFNRQEDTLIAIASPTAQLSGSFADSPEDADGNGLYETLILDVGLTVSKAGDYSISANLTKAGQLIANTTTYITLSPGAKTIELRFSGDDIYQSGLDGPYTVANLIVTDVQSAVPSVVAEDVWTTQAYDHTQFGSVRNVYLPLILK